MKIDVFQMVGGDRTHYLRFEDYENYKRETGSETIRPDDYTCVFCGEVLCDGLDGVYELFNRDFGRPQFCGHSLSVSDLVYVWDEDKHGLWYCEPMGWKQVHWGI